jgi:hypothetical protein
MALLSDLVTAVARAEGMEEVTVGIFARHAREAGLISQAGRGRGAARMTVRDAVNLIIAVNACGLAKDVQYGVEQFRRLPNTGVRHEAYPELLGRIFAPRRQLGDALETLVEASAPDAQGNVPLETGMWEAAGAWLDGLPRRTAAPLDPDLVGRALVRLEITFSRPKPEAEIVILIKSTYLSRLFTNPGDLIVARAMFRNIGVGKYRDRRDRVTITEQTIAAVSETLVKIT